MSGTAKKFGIAIFGVGRIGKIHARSLLLNPRAQLRWLVDLNVNAAKSFAESYGCAAQCVSSTQLDSVLKDDSVEGVIVCSPTSEHEYLIKASLDAGKAVFSEKPISSDVDTTEACFEKAEAKGCPLLCAFQRRFDPSFMAVKAGLESGERGRLRLLRSSSHDLSAPPIEYIKSSGGILKDSTIHDIDISLWMSASPAKKVYVQGCAFDSQIKSAGDMDLVVVSVEHESGSVSVLDNGRRCAYGYDQRLEAMCDNGSYIISNRSSHTTVEHSTSISALPPIDQCFTTRYFQAYANEMEHFVDVLEGVATPKVNKEDVLSAMKLAEAATLSAKTGKVVDIKS